VNIPADGRTWRVGELAERTGITVRALHHYHEIGLLVPSGRNGAGHRLYTDEDVRRLHRIHALRGFGLSLAEIGDVLAGTGVDPKELVRRQLAQVDERIAAAGVLRRALVGVLEALEQPSAGELVELIEVMTTVEQTLTPQQVEQMSAHRAAMTAKLTPDELAEMSAHRSAMAAKLTPEELAAMSARRAALMPQEG
jgi:MerR family transcriptional regulator, thiopeptide resistance regulator